MAKYGVFESINMKSTKGAERIYDAVATVDIENGTFGYLDGLATGETVVYNFAKGTAEGKTVVVVDQPAWDYDTTYIANQRKDKFIIPAGTKFRVRVVAKGDDFGINDACVTEATKGDLAKGVYLTIDTTGKLVASATATVGAIFEATVMNLRKSGNTIVTTGAGTYGYTDTIYECAVTTLA